MNHSVIRNILGTVLKFEGVFLVLPILVSLHFRENEGFAFAIVAVICTALGFALTYRKPKHAAYRATEGLVAVALSWIVLSIFGALPFVLTGEIPSFTDALFETISGFTTTGASILSDLDSMSKSCLFWRSFTHWVGGMGVIVFLIAVMPMTGGYNMHLMRAESPGPSVGKLVPKARTSALILYVIYFVLTISEIIILFISGMPFFDAVTISFGSAGTGGFAVRTSGMSDYSIFMQAIICVFIILFGVNFNFYFFLIGKDKKSAFKIGEVRWYLGIIAASILVITINIRGFYDSLFMSFHNAAFQVATIITTTGYATADFNLWPNLSKAILVTLMFLGACAGSTGGGIKVSRVVILLYEIKDEIRHFVHPHAVNTTKMDGKTIPKETIHGVNRYLATYVFIFIFSVLLVCIFESTGDLETNFTAVTATFNNIGPGLGLVGPLGNYGYMSIPTKYILMFDMLAGRLELYPMLMLFVPEVWKRR